jgi:hypothetical protein
LADLRRIARQQCLDIWPVWLDFDVGHSPF